MRVWLASSLSSASASTLRVVLSDNRAHVARGSPQVRARRRCGGRRRHHRERPAQGRFDRLPRGRDRAQNGQQTGGDRQTHRLLGRKPNSAFNFLTQSGFLTEHQREEKVGQVRAFAT